MMLNTYTIFVIDLSDSKHYTIFKHQSFQMWESSIFGTYLPRSQEYVTVNIDGISVASLSLQEKRVIPGIKNDYICHTL